MDRYTRDFLGRQTPTGTAILTMGGKQAPLPYLHLLRGLPEGQAVWRELSASISWSKCAEAVEDYCPTNKQLNVKAGAVILSYVWDCFSRC